MTERMERLMTAGELAGVFGVHRTTLLRWEQLDPNFPKPIRVGYGRKKFWRPADIRAFLDGAKEGPAQ